MVKDEERVEHSRSLLRTVLPFLEKFNQEQSTEKEIEANIQGIMSFPPVKLASYDICYALVDNIVDARLK